MDDEVGVRVGDGVGHLQEQLEPRLDAERPLGGVAIDARALDVLEDEKRLAGCA